MSVLAHVVSRGLSPEPAATQALAHILGEREALEAFVQGLAFTGVSFAPRRAEAEAAAGDGRPDISIYDAAGVRRMVVENKFWAGLTDAQPTGYLEELSRDEAVPSALVFIVPTVRIPSIWRELVRRCDESNVGLVEGVAGHATVWGSLPGSQAIAVLGWERVLDGLEAVKAARSDVGQLRALTDAMDAQAFLPIRAEELTSVDMARRLINYADLVEPIVEELRRRGVADTIGLRPSHGYHGAGRYLHMRDQLVGLWLGVDMDLWRDAGTTPLWWVMGNSEWNGVQAVWEELDRMFDDIRVRGGSKCLPVRLRTGVERDAVIADAADQMEEIAGRIVAALHG